MSADLAYHVTSLNSEGQADGFTGLSGPATATTVSPDALDAAFDAPWRGVAVVRLAPGGALGPRGLEGSEVMMFVLGGTGVAHLHHGPVALREGIALTLFKDELLHITAVDHDVEFFIAEIGVE